MFGVALIALAVLVLISANVPFVRADPTPNETASSVTITGIVDVTVNCSAIGFGSLAPGAVNSSSTNCFPLVITIHDDTNTQTQIFVNGSNLLNNTVVYGQRNVTYSNLTDGYATEMNSTFTSGSDNVGDPFDDWVGIADSSTDATRNAFWWISAPSTIPKGVYAGTIYVKVTDTG